jgi:hypothetical protein
MMAEIRSRMSGSDMIRFISASCSVKPHHVVGRCDAIGNSPYSRDVMARRMFTRAALSRSWGQQLPQHSAPNLTAFGEVAPVQGVE